MLTPDPNPSKTKDNFKLSKKKETYFDLILIFSKNATGSFSILLSKYQLWYRSINKYPIYVWFSDRQATLRTNQLTSFSNEISCIYNYNKIIEQIH